MPKTIFKVAINLFGRITRITFDSTNLHILSSILVPHRSFILLLRFWFNHRLHKFSLFRRTK